MLPSTRLGILAGGGVLPARVIAACRAAGREFFVLAFEDQADSDTVAGTPHAWVRLGAAGRAIELLRAAGVEELVMAGAVRRPSLAALRPDRRAARFLARLGPRSIGDNGLLRALAAVIERDEGFRIVGADSVLADLLAPLGPFGRLRPGAEDARDIVCGIAAARRHGARDRGHAVVTRYGGVLDAEGADGTDALLERCRARRDDAPGGVLVKVMKPRQDRRLDPPAIGPETVRRAAAAGLRGIAVESGAVLVIDREIVVRTADADGLFVVGVEVGA